MLHPLPPATIHTQLPVPLRFADGFGTAARVFSFELRGAVERIADSSGFLFYLRQEGRGIGLYAKLDAYALHDAGLGAHTLDIPTSAG